MTRHILTPWDHVPRETLTDQQRAALFLRKRGICHRCTRKIRSEVWYAEHLNALQTGGDNSNGNWEVTCCNCFPLKNAEDSGKATKMRHVAVSCYVPRSQRQQKWKPLPGSKRSPWKRKLDGSWERRS